MEQKIVIGFDGPDNVGKGTQIKLFRKRYSHIPFLIMNVDPPQGPNHNSKIKYGMEQTRRLLKSMEQIPYSQIYDRIHFSEYAYSMFRGGHETQDITDIEKSVPETFPYTLIFTFIDSPENISSRDDRNSLYKKEDLEVIDNLINRFKEISNASHYKNVVIDIEGKDIQTVHEEVIAHTEKVFPWLEGKNNRSI